MKKFITVFGLLAVSALALTGCGKSKETLKIYNAGEYIDTSLISKFEKENKCKVVYETFDSNETMYTKIMSGENYDVLVPSDYMIERLIKEDKLEKIDNTKYKDNIYMYDSERDSFMIALKALGYSMNTTDKSEIDQAYQWLIEQRDSMNPIYAGDDVIDNMISGNKAMAVVYSGDGAYIMSENEKLDFFEPEEGTNTWYDAMVIMKGTKHSELAHKFINFMLDNDNAAANSAEVGYTSPVTKAYEQMKSEDYKGIDAYAPNTGNEKNEVFRYQDTEIKQYFADLWTKVKAY